MQLRVEKRRALLRTRKALDWTQRFPEIAREGRALPDCIIDGEICALDERGVPSFAGLQQALSDGHTAELIFFVFDLLFLEGEDLRELPLEERKGRLAELISQSASARFTDAGISLGTHAGMRICPAGPVIVESAWTSWIAGLESSPPQLPE